MKRRKFLTISIIIFSVLLTTFGFYGYQVVFSPNILVGKQTEYLLIPSNATFAAVRDSLYKNDYIQDALSFSFLSRLMKYDRQVKPGRYRLESNMSNLETIRLLRSGEQEPVNITFNNVRTVEELAEKITANVEAKAEDLLRLINDPVRISEYGFNAHTIRCMFIPNTYEVYWTITAEELFERMKMEYDRFWNEERLKKAMELRLTPPEVIILASIVEAETNKAEEAPVVAGLYINRLRLGMPLQADPTLKYAANDFTIRRVLNVHKEIDSPYNTYKYAGLPPGPINLPPVPVIDAVLNHQKHKYLYMCAREDFSGYHNFTSSLTEHLNNARKYQRALNQARLFK